MTAHNAVDAIAQTIQQTPTSNSKAASYCVEQRIGLIIINTDDTDMIDLLLQTLFLSPTLKRAFLHFLRGDPTGQVYLEIINGHPHRVCIQKHKHTLYDNEPHRP